MKRAIIFLGLVCIICFTQCAFAGYNEYQSPKGGFKGTSEAKYTTVTQAKKLPDDTYVILKGNIVSKIGHEKYLFKDTTGTIEIEIDDKNWRGVEAGPNDIVIIEGETDKEWNSVSIDVDTIRLN